MKICQEKWGDFVTKSYDLVVFGGGTVGGAIFLDAVTRGLKTALIEKSRIGHQTNRASLGFIQRDPKYLHTDVDVVYMNAVDCGLLKTIAGYFLKRQKIIIPHFSDSKYPLWLLEKYIGVLDCFAHLSKSEKHQRLFQKQILAKEPLLRSDATGGILYDEWICNPVELNSAFIKTACELGGELFEFFKPVAWTPEFFCKEKKIKHVLVRNEFTGETKLIEAEYFINATGPWAPSFLKFFGIPPFPTRLTKGTSIIVDLKLSEDAIIVFNKEGKYITVLPLGLSKTLIGPTNRDIDEEITQNPNKLSPSEDEIEELIETVSKFFKVKISKENIVETRWGLRPQLKHRGVPDKVIHEFAIINHGQRDEFVNLFSVFGGKLSNQIRMAKEAVDCVSDLKWRIPELRIEKNGEFRFESCQNSIEKLYKKKFALSFKDKVGKVAFRKKIKSLFFVAYSILKGEINAK